MLQRKEADTAMQVVSKTKTTEVGAGWRQRLPVLCGERVALRELRAADAAMLFAMVTPPEVSRFISPPPSSVPTFERFIERTRAQQAAGSLVCFAVTLKGHDAAIGIFQIRELEANFKTAEWGFVLGSPFWGIGLFEECAALVLDFAFTQLGVHRMEARAAVGNGRGNRALQKIGGVQEGVLRQAFLCGGEYVDQVIYGIVDDEWRASRSMPKNTPRIVVH